VPEVVARIDITDGRVHGVTTAGGTVRSAGVVVLCAGAHSGRIGALPSGARPRVHPVKGQTLRLRLPVDALPPRILRGSVKGSPVYLVPRAPRSAPAEPGRAPAASSVGELVVGASSEEAGFDCTPRAGAVYELLRDAQSLLPAVSEAELVEVSTALRPGSPDNAPRIGPAGPGGPEGLIIATGHYRNGILLTPITGDGVSALIADGALPPELLSFQPERLGPQEVR